MQSTRSFRLSGWSGKVNDGFVADDRLEEIIRHLVDPSRAEDTLHWGRNYLYAVTIADLEGDNRVVVKQFPNAGWRGRWKRRLWGSKAERSWRAATAVTGAGILTPEPLLLIESERPGGPSLYVTRRVEKFVESRFFFRALAVGKERAEFPWIDRAELMKRTGELFRRLHEAGVWHRDLSIGNLLLERGEVADRFEIWLIDLDRSQIRERLGTVRRLRDICRLPILDPQDRALFWRAYWQDESSLRSLRGWGFRFLQQAFLAKNRWKPRLRRPLEMVGSWLVPRKAYGHIPEPPEHAGARDKAVWDSLSDQPHQHASRRERASIRIADASAHLSGLGAALGSAPRAWRRYRALAERAQARPVAWPGTGIALRPQSALENELLAALDRLGSRQVLLRLHPWQAEHGSEEALARELHARGYDLVFALPQNRELVRDRQRWRSAVEELAERFRPFGDVFQIGQAINRSKWGIWNLREYLDLAESAAEVFSRHPGTRLMGPAVIDFEFQVALAALNMRARAHFDIVSALLYVDRRGAPENPQLGFDTIGKCALLKAIAETSPNCGDTCWITEFNWPLWEGPHSPAGRTVSVNEEVQADYLARYFLQTLTCGFVERVYWWQLAARGYGLLDPSSGSLRERPSFRAMATLESVFSGSRFVEARSPTDNTRTLRFEADGRSLLAAWSLDEPTTVSLPGRVRLARSRDGYPLEADGAAEIRLTSSPVYLELDGSSSPTEEPGQLTR